MIRSVISLCYSEVIGSRISVDRIMMRFFMEPVLSVSQVFRMTIKENIVVN